MRILRACLLALLLLPALAQAQIAFRAAATGINEGMGVQHSALGTVAQGTGATITPGLPARVAGDMLLLTIEVRDTNALTIPNWTLLTTATTGANHRASIYWRIATNNATDTASIAHANTPGTRRLLIARIVAFSNVSATSPFDGAVSTGSSATNTVATGGITTTNACSVRVATVHIADDNTITTGPAGFYQSFHSTTTTGTDGAVGLWYLEATAAGAQGSVSFTHSANDPAHASQFALRPGGLNINVPSGTQVGDVMIATVAIRPANTNATNNNAVTVCPPAGWTLVRDTINNAGGATGGTGSRLLTYTRVATGAEPASYSWYAQLNNPSIPPATVFVTGAGAIVSYSGVDNTTPVNVEGGNTTGSSTSHTGNSITTTLANTMLLSTYTFLSADTWNAPPAGMTERVDQSAPASPPGNAVGIALGISEEPRPTAGATGNRTFTASGAAAADAGIVHMMALRQAPPSTPGGFNAFESTTASGAITGYIRTKVGGVAVSIDLVALNPARTAVLTTFTGTVRVEILNSADNSGALNATTGCRASWTTIQTLSPDIVLAAGDLGRKTITFTVPDVYRDARVRVTFPVASPTATGCSTDNFAIRPSSLTVALSDSNWEMAGTTRALTNVATAGGTVHKAGRPLTIRVTPAPVTATLYDGDATVGALTCTVPATCANGALTVGAFSNPVPGSGLRQSTTASYNEAGAFDLTMVDQTFAAVDSIPGDGTPLDCTAAGLYICQTGAPLAAGRFVPDHFTIVSVTAPEFQTFGVADGSCSVPPAGARRSFTYMGQFFGYTTIPSAIVEARNFSEGVTRNYRGALWKLTAAGVALSLANTPAMSGMDTSLVGAPTLVERSSPDNGTGTLTANAADRFAFVRDPATATAPFNADLALGWAVSDANENGVDQGIIGSSAFAFASVGFDSGNSIRYGRLRLGNANGSHLVPLPVRMEAQYWGYTNPPANTVLGWITNTSDHCTAVANNNVAMSTFSGNLVACETAISGGGTMSGGRRTLILATPGGANDGAVVLTANLTAAPSGTTCVVVGGGTVAAAGANRTYLQGNWSGAAHDDNPAARATFGVFKGAGEVIFIRENF